MTLLRQPNGTYHVEFQYLGKRIHRSTRTKSLKAARDFEDRLRHEIFAPPQRQQEEREPQRMTLGQAVDRYLAHHLEPQSHNPRTLYGTRCLLGKLQERLGGPERPLHEIRGEDVSTLKDDLLREGRSAATVNQYVAYLRAVMRRAVGEWGVTLDLPPMRPLRLRNARSRCLTVEEEASLASALEDRPALAALVRFLLGSGARLSEATGLRWQDVDLGESLVTFRSTKNGETRTVPLSSDLRGFLVALRGEQGSAAAPWVLPYYTVRTAPRRYRNPHGAFKAACRRGTLADLRIHDLRHTFASRLVARGVSLYQVSRLLGHKDVRMTQRYSHLSVEDLRAAVGAPVKG
jgi:integrase